MIIRTQHNQPGERVSKETIQYQDGDRTNPKNFISIDILNNGEIKVSFNPKHLAHASKSVRKKLQPWLCSKFGGVPGQRRWKVSEQQLKSFLLSPATEMDATIE